MSDVKEWEDMVANAETGGEKPKTLDDYIADRDRAKAIYEQANLLIESAGMDAAAKAKADAEAHEKRAREFARKAAHAAPHEYAALQRDYLNR